LVKPYIKDPVYWDTSIDAYNTNYENYVNCKANDRVLVPFEIYLPYLFTDNVSVTVGIMIKCTTGTVRVYRCKYYVKKYKKDKIQQYKATQLQTV
jgi:hypothetical protein